MRRCLGWKVEMNREQPLALLALPIPNMGAMQSTPSSFPASCGVAIHSRALDDDSSMGDMLRRRPSSALCSLPRTCKDFTTHSAERHISDVNSKHHGVSLASLYTVSMADNNVDTRHPSPSSRRYGNMESAMSSSTSDRTILPSSKPSSRARMRRRANSPRSSPVPMR
jgi:hypothetical protein